MADPNAPDFKDAVSLSGQILSNFKELEKIEARLNKINNTNNDLYKNIISSQKAITKELDNQSDQLEKAKKLQISKKEIGKLSDELKAQSTIIKAQNDLIKTQLSDTKTRQTVERADLDIEQDKLRNLQNQIKLEEALIASGRSSNTANLQSLEQQLIAQEKTVVTQQKQVDLVDRQADALEEITQYNEEIEKHLDREAELSAKIQKYYTGNKLAVAATEGILGGISKIPFAKNFIDADKATKAMNKNIAEGGSGMGTLFKGLAAGIKGLETASVVLTIFQAALSLFNLIKDAMFGADKQVTSLSKNLSVSKEEARILRDNFQGVSDSVAGIYGTMPNLIDAQLQLSELSNATFMFSRDQLDTQVELTKLLGLSVEEATKLQSNFILSKGEAKEQVDIVYDQVAAFSNQNKILFNGRKILSEMSKVSGQILATFRGSTEALAKAVMRAEAVGMTLEQSRKSAQGLLNFESSIESELEAELLTGRQLNLERARGLALQGDYAGVAEEIASQVGDFYEFGKLNVLQQEALAQSVGMQADELADVLKRREFITEEVQAELDRTRALAKEARAKKETDKANALEKRALAIEQGVLDGKSLKTAQETVDAQEKFAQAVEIVKAKFAEMFTGEVVDKLGNTLIKLANFLQDFINSVMNRGLWETLTGGGIQEEAVNRVAIETASQKAKIGKDTILSDEEKTKQLLLLKEKEKDIMEAQGAIAAEKAMNAAGGFNYELGKMVAGWFGWTSDAEKAIDEFNKKYNNSQLTSAQTQVSTPVEARILNGNPLTGTNSDNSELASLMKEFIQTAKNPKEVVIQNNLAVDSQKFFAEASKHSVQMNS